MAEKEINIERTFVGLIDNDGIVVGKRWIPLCFGEEDTVCHQLNVSTGTGSIIKPDFATHFASPSDPKFLGDTLRYGESGDSARLGAANKSADTESRFEAYFGYLSCFAGTRFASDHHHLMPTNSRDNILAARANGKSGRIFGPWNILSTKFTSVN